MAFSHGTSFGALSAENSIDDLSFERVAKLLRSESGIVLSPSKKSLVVSRLSRRLRALGIKKFSAYCDFLEATSGRAERREMLFLLTTNVTDFFRESHHFESLRSEILEPLLDRAKAGGRVRIWSAGCSSGQEPYSLALTILNIMPNAGRLDIRILATDIDANMIAIGANGEYEVEKEFSETPENRRYFDRSMKDESIIRFSSDVRGMITFRELNLLSEWPMTGPFDIIFCRNVVIYFDNQAQEQLWERYADFLPCGGRLFVGHSERVTGSATSRLSLVGTTQYVRI